MRRVAVIGCSGAGKTTLARALGRSLGLEVVHGDFLGRSGGERARGEVWQRLEAGVLTRDGWVLDAMRLSSLDRRVAAADTVVFLDLPRRTCLGGIVRRRLRHRGASPTGSTPPSCAGSGASPASTGHASSRRWPQPPPRPRS